jgi:hypothetical protein
MRHQAFRAANQAIGRCIRHKADYGRCCCCLLQNDFHLSSAYPTINVFVSVLFVDSRFGAEDRQVATPRRAHAPSMPLYFIPTRSLRYLPKWIRGQMNKCNASDVRRLQPSVACSITIPNIRHIPCPHTCFRMFTHPSGCPNTPTFFRSYGKRVSIEN